MGLLHLAVVGTAVWLLLFQPFHVQVSAFSVQPVHSRRCFQLLSTRTAEDTDNPRISAEKLFETATFLEVTLAEHKPLGCTVEESLAAVTIELAENEKQKLHYVFLSAIKPGGNAEKAGLLPGDVIVGVTGLFGELENIAGLGIEKVSGLVSARPEDQPLTIRVARGTSVLADHERVLVDLCSDPTLDGKDADECIVSFLKQGYELDDGDDDNDAENDVDMDSVNSILNSEETGSANGSNQIDGEDLVASMFSIWAEDMDLPLNPPVDAVVLSKEEVASKPKPWSSRSSPSGTFVRDPKTGEMRNIDS